MIAEAILRYARELDLQVSGTEWYLFGSTLHQSTVAHDIDIMILCPTDAAADRMRTLIDPYHFCLPIDLSLLTFEEGAELRFVERRKALRVFP